LNTKICFFFLKSKTSAIFFKAIVRLANNPAYYYQRNIYKALKGVGADEEAVFRYIISTSESLLQNIKAEYLEQKGITLHTAIDNNFRGDCQDCLFSLINGDD
jgi:hypothetical protein